MKRITALLLTALLLLCTGCVRLPTTPELSGKAAEVQTIEIYRTELRYDEHDLHEFTEENEPLCSVDAAAVPKLCETLEGLRYTRETLLIPAAADGGCDLQGYVFCVRYPDGAYDLIGETGLFSYQNPGYHYDHADYCGDTPWDELFAPYLPGDTDR
ncbi:MAG: hypothetical protein IJ112_00725 [Oscillospiraceae bacterium]|nr:hypothetical protein [Oscillospiraceae bacterium]